jgi:hypothetical protein
MEITVNKKEKKQVKTLLVEAGVRYWEDSDVNGIEDTDGTLIPCRIGKNWCPKIDIETGQILNWNIGTTANVHYKVCDDGTYKLLDENENIVASIDGYVPKILDIYDDSFGDYIILKIDENGFIDKWNNHASLKNFENED